MEIGDECLHSGKLWRCWLISESHYHLIRCEPQPLKPPLCRLVDLPIEPPQKAARLPLGRAGGN